MKVQNNISAINRNYKVKQAKKLDTVDSSFDNTLSEVFESEGAKDDAIVDDFTAILEQANIARATFENSANVTNENIAGTTNVVKDEMAKKIMAYKK